MARTRDPLIHAYDRVDLEEVWQAGLWAVPHDPQSCY